MAKARQGVIVKKYSRTSSTSMLVNSSRDSQSHKAPSIVRVAPYVRMVHGKAIMVAGYTYTRKN